MDYVYICRKGDNEELRYSLRCLEKNLPEGNVWIIGNRPYWYTGNFIKVEDGKDKFENIRQCIKISTEIKEISDSYVLMNDDFFVLKEIDSVPILHGGLLFNKIIRYKERSMSSKYIRLLEKTYKELSQYGIKDPIDYDIHTPIIFNKEILRQSIDIAYFPRSAYGNFAKIGGEKIDDVKVYRGSDSILKQKDIPFISTQDSSFPIVYKNFLKNHYNTPSKYESIRDGV